MVINEKRYFQRSWLRFYGIRQATHTVIKRNVFVEPKHCRTRKRWSCAKTLRKLSSESFWFETPMLFQFFTSQCKHRTFPIWSWWLFDFLPMILFIRSESPIKLRNTSSEVQQIGLEKSSKCYFLNHYLVLPRKWKKKCFITSTTVNGEKYFRGYLHIDEGMLESIAINF